MIFFGLLLALSIYIIISLGVAWFFYHLFESPRAKKRAAGIVMIIALLIPTADHFMGYLVFQSYCKEEAGLKVKKIVTNVEGFLDEGHFIGGHYSELSKLGYSFIEERVNENIKRTLVTNNGELKAEIVSAPKSEYSYFFNKRELPFGIIRQSRFIKKISVQPVATYTTFYFKGGWVIRELSKIGGGGHSCPADASNFLEAKFITSILKP